MPPFSITNDITFQILGTLTAIGCGGLGLHYLVPPVPILKHSHNLDLCIGCEKCVAVCPTSVLAMDESTHKASIVDLDECISCRGCETVCPTGSLRMHYPKQEPRKLKVPDIDDYYQVNGQSGLYLIGHAAGSPQIKNAINCGRAVIEHARLMGGLVPLAMQTESKKPNSPDDIIEELDVIIVGSGPGGLSAAMTCAEHKLRFKVFESAKDVNYTIATYPVGKDIHPDPPNVKCVGLLPLWHTTKEKLNHEWMFHLTEKGIGRHISVESEVVSVKRESSSNFIVGVLCAEGQSSRRRDYRAQRVILAVGGFAERKRPTCDGSTYTKPQLDDAKLYRQQTVLVLGGGDAGVQAATQLGKECKRVVFLYRKGKNELSATKKNIAEMDENVVNLDDARDSSKSILAYYNSDVISYEKNKNNKIVATLKMPHRKGQNKGELRPTEFDRVFACLGPERLDKTLQKFGIQHIERDQRTFRRSATDKLVEQLLGQSLADNNTPRRPEPIESSQSEMLDDATIVDLAASSLTQLVLDAGTIGNRTRQELEEDATLVAQMLQIPGEHALMPMPDKVSLAGQLPPVRDRRKLLYRLRHRRLNKSSR